MKHIKGLDALRAFAVSFVILAHWGPHTFKSEPLNFIFGKLMPNGMFGVDLFFVLSGYLITKILLNARDEAPANGRLQIIKSFYIRRMLRIFPIYFLLVFIVAYVLDDMYVRNNIVYYLTYTSNILSFKENAWQSFSHTWSLGVEEQFYLIWPWVIIYSPKKHLLSIILFSIGFGVLSSLILNHNYGTFSLVLLPPCITAFAIGALYAHVQTYQQFKKIATTTFLILLPVCIILLVINNLGNKLVLIRAVNSVIAINLIIYATKESYNRVTKYIFNNKVLVNIGKISYGIYLYHYILPSHFAIFVTNLQHKFKFSDKILRILTVPPSAYIIHLGILFLISILSYRYIELKFLKLKRYFNYVSDKKLYVSNVNVQ